MKVQTLGISGLIYQRIITARKDEEVLNMITVRKAGKHSVYIMSSQVVHRERLKTHAAISDRLRSSIIIEEFEA